MFNIFPLFSFCFTDKGLRNSISVSLYPFFTNHLSLSCPNSLPCSPPSFSHHKWTLSRAGGRSCHESSLRTDCIQPSLWHDKWVLVYQRLEVNLLSHRNWLSLGLRTVTVCLCVCAVKRTWCWCSAVFLYQYYKFKVWIPLMAHITSTYCCEWTNSNRIEWNLI